MRETYRIEIWGVYIEQWDGLYDGLYYGTLIDKFTGAIYPVHGPSYAVEIYR